VFADSYRAATVRERSTGTDFPRSVKHPVSWARASVYFSRAIVELVRYFLSRRLPEAESILLVESGSRGLLEQLAPKLRETWGEGVPIDLVTCYARMPQGFPEERTRVYRVSGYRGREGRRKLYRELARIRYSYVGIVCSGEPIMTKWKWALALRLRAKIFVINENCDYFWLDRGHLGPMRELVLFRSGLAGAGAVRTLARIFSLPFTLAYLLLYATVVHARRALIAGRRD